jgi:hypothetical protein
VNVSRKNWSDLASSKDAAHIFVFGWLASFKLFSTFVSSIWAAIFFTQLVRSYPFALNARSETAQFNGNTW